jgi:hypothetical protein
MLFWLSERALVMNPAVFSDPQVIPRLVPPRRRGRPTLYSAELIEEFCGLLVDGMTIEMACKEAGMPSKRTIKYWLKKYPEFRREFEESVQFRNECWLDDNIDMAADVTGAPTGDRKLICDQRWKRYNGMGLKGKALSKAQVRLMMPRSWHGGTDRSGNENWVDQIGGTVQAAPVGCGRHRCPQG